MELMNREDGLKIKVVLDDGAYMPEKAHESDAGFDLKTPGKIVIPPKSAGIIPTGVHIQIPFEYVGFLKSKSGLNVKNGILCEGVIDSGYTGGIVAKLYNHSNEEKVFEKGDKITQIVILPIPDVEMELVDRLEDIERGNGGFGSSGR